MDIELRETDETKRLLTQGPTFRDLNIMREYFKQLQEHYDSVGKILPNGVTIRRH